MNPILFALPCSSKAIQRGANGHGHGAGAADAGARGGFGIGYQREAALRPEELGDFGKEGKAIAFGLHERGEGGEGFFTLRVAGHETNALATVGLNAAGSVKGDGGVDRNRAGVKQVKRPDVERATGEVHTRRRLRFDDHRWSQP